MSTAIMAINLVLFMSFYPSFISGLILPLTTDLTSITSHVALLEQAMASVQTQLQTNTNELTILKTKLQTTENELKSVKADQKTTSAKLAVAESQLNSTQEELANLQQTITGGPFNLNDTLLKNVSDLGSGVAFQTSLSRGRNQWKTLIFDTVDYNPSAAYNESSGVFTAPVPGSYLFWANMHVDFNNYGHTNKYVYLKSGSKTLATGFTRTSSANKNGVISFTAITHLDEGDDVYFSTDSIANVIEGDGVSSYGGTLLHITL